MISFFTHKSIHVCENSFEYVLIHTTDWIGHHDMYTDSVWFGLVLGYIWPCTLQFGFPRALTAPHLNNLLFPPKKKKKKPLIICHYAVQYDLVSARLGQILKKIWTNLGQSKCFFFLYSELI